MRKISRSAIVPYSAEQMYTLVEDVESYPDFLPWCGGAVLHWRDGDVLEGSVEMHRAGVRRWFRTRNTMRQDEAIDMTLVEGPFSHLSGGWQFHALGTAGCKVSLDMEFKIRSRTTDRLLGRYFEEICNSLVDAFVKRAADVYVPGESSSDSTT
jgi:ribosome-associated toxin RatA of RatAB toxin-antitoxin module